MRRCLGAAFAQFEMRRVLRTILENADLRPATTRAEPFERRPVTVVPRHGTPAVLTRQRQRAVTTTYSDAASKVPSVASLNDS
jgi:cytochrome P450